MTAVIAKENIEVLFSQEEIQNRITELAQQISKDYKDTQDLVVIGVLKGAALFTSDLIRKLDIPCQLEFIRLASYQTGTESSGEIRVFDLSVPNLKDKDILIAEDIVDSGRTAEFLINFFQEQVGVRSMRIASLLDKPCRRLEALRHIKPDYCCFTVDDKFILGYGLDYEQRFRQLPYLGHISGLS